MYCKYWHQCFEIKVVKDTADQNSYTVHAVTEKVGQDSQFNESVVVAIWWEELTLAFW